MAKTIMITGSSGRLGRELARYFPDAKDPEDVNFISFDLRNSMSIKHAFLNIKPDLVIHCAAMTDVSKCEDEPWNCYETNALGTYYMAKSCKIWNAKMIYISTDHVFDGHKGNYREWDVPNPQGHYAKSKLMGEWYVLSDPNNLVIRTSFMKDFPYEKAYVDKYFNAEPVKEIAKMIKKAIDMDLKGLWHIAGKKKTIMDLARKLKPGVKPMMLKDRPKNNAGLAYLRDTSMNIDKWEEQCKRNS